MEKSLETPSSSSATTSPTPTPPVPFDAKLISRTTLSLAEFQDSILHSIANPSHEFKRLMPYLFGDPEMMRSLTILRMNLETLSRFLAQPHTTQESQEEAFARRKELYRKVYSESASQW